MTDRRFQRTSQLWFPLSFFAVCGWAIYFGGWGILLAFEGFGHSLKHGYPAKAPTFLQFVKEYVPWFAPAD